MHRPSRRRYRAGTALAALSILLAAGCSAGEEGARRSGPSVTIEPRSGPPGTDVQVRAHDFPPDVIVDVGFGAPQSRYEVVARTRTDGKGSTAAAVRVPANTAPGPHLFVMAYPPTLLRASSDTFVVTAPTAPAALVVTDTPAAGAADTQTTPGGNMEIDTARKGVVRVTGRLTDEGVECPALRGDDRKLYTLAGDTGSFGPGDRVTVVGTVAEMSFCMQGTTLEVQSIGAAGG